MKRWAYERIWPLQSAIGNQCRLDISAQLWTSWKENGEIMIESAKASTTLKNMKPAQTVSIAGGTMFRPFMSDFLSKHTHGSVRTHLEKQWAAQPPERKHTGPQNTASGIKESSRLSCGGAMLLTGLRGAEVSLRTESGSVSDRCLEPQQVESEVSMLYQELDWNPLRWKRQSLIERMRSFVSLLIFLKGKVKWLGWFKK